MSRPHPAAAPAVAEQPKSQKLPMRVHMLDGSIKTFSVPMKCTGAALWGEIVKSVHLVEADYFDLEFIDHQKHHQFQFIKQCWLDHDKPILKQMHPAMKEFAFRFVVKFYPPDPALFEDDYTRYLFALQVKSDLASGAMVCNDNTAALLVSYILQAELGDFNSQEEIYLCQTKLTPTQSPSLIKKIMHYHKKLLGMPAVDAEFYLLDTARKVELYGIRMHAARDHESVPLNLTVTHMGVLVFQKNTKINTFSWAKIRKLSFKRKKFLLKLHPEGYGYYKDTVEFYFETRDECKTFWKRCIEHHTFFRCQDSGARRARNALAARGSTFRYQGRTQKQLIEHAKETLRQKHLAGAATVHRFDNSVGRAVSMGPALQQGKPSLRSDANYASLPHSRSVGPHVDRGSERAVTSDAEATLGNATSKPTRKWGGQTDSGLGRRAFTSGEESATQDEYDLQDGLVKKANGQTVLVTSRPSRDRTKRREPVPDGYTEIERQHRLTQLDARGSKAPESFDESRTSDERQYTVDRHGNIRDLRGNLIDKLTGQIIAEPKHFNSLSIDSPIAPPSAYNDQRDLRANYDQMVYYQSGPNQVPLVTCVQSPKSQRRSTADTAGLHQPRAQAPAHHDPRVSTLHDPRVPTHHDTRGSTHHDTRVPTHQAPRVPTNHDPRLSMHPPNYTEAVQQQSLRSQHHPNFDKYAPRSIDYVTGDSSSLERRRVQRQPGSMSDSEHPTQHRNYAFAANSSLDSVPMSGSSAGEASSDYPNDIVEHRVKKKKHKRRSSKDPTVPIMEESGGQIDSNQLIEATPPPPPQFQTPQVPLSTDIDDSATFPDLLASPSSLKKDTLGSLEFQIVTKVPSRELLTTEVCRSESPVTTYYAQPPPAGLSKSSPRSIKTRSEPKSSSEQHSPRISPKLGRTSFPMPQLPNPNPSAVYTRTSPKQTPPLKPKSPVSPVIEHISYDPRTIMLSHPRNITSAPKVLLSSRDILCSDAQPPKSPARSISPLAHQQSSPSLRTGKLLRQDTDMDRRRSDGTAESPDRPLLEIGSHRMLTRTPSPAIKESSLEADAASPSRPAFEAQPDAVDSLEAQPERSLELQQNETAPPEVEPLTVQHPDVAPVTTPPEKEGVRPRQSQSLPPASHNHVNGVSGNNIQYTLHKRYRTPSPKLRGSPKRNAGEKVFSPKRSGEKPPTLHPKPILNIAEIRKELMQQRASTLQSRLARFQDNSHRVVSVQNLPARNNFSFVDDTCADSNRDLFLRHLEAVRRDRSPHAFSSLPRPGLSTFRPIERPNEAQPDVAPPRTPPQDSSPPPSNHVPSVAVSRTSLGSSSHDSRHTSTESNITVIDQTMLDTNGYPPGRPRSLDRAGWAERRAENLSERRRSNSATDSASRVGKASHCEAAHSAAPVNSSPSAAAAKFPYMDDDSSKESTPAQRSRAGSTRSSVSKLEPHLEIDTCPAMSTVTESTAIVTESTATNTESTVTNTESTAKITPLPATTNSTNVVSKSSTTTCATRHESTIISTGCRTPTSPIHQRHWRSSSPPPQLASDEDDEALLVLDEVAEAPPSSRAPPSAKLHSDGMSLVIREPTPSEEDPEFRGVETLENGARREYRMTESEDNMTIEIIETGGADDDALYVLAPLDDDRYRMVIDDERGGAMLESIAEDSSNPVMPYDDARSRFFKSVEDMDGVIVVENWDGEEATDALTVNGPGHPTSPLEVPQIAILPATPVPSMSPGTPDDQSMSTSESSSSNADLCPTDPCDDEAIQVLENPYLDELIDVNDQPDNIVDDYVEDDTVVIRSTAGDRRGSFERSQTSPCTGGAKRRCEVRKALSTYSDDFSFGGGLSPIVIPKHLLAIQPRDTSRTLSHIEEEAETTGASPNESVTDPQNYDEDDRSSLTRSAQDTYDSRETLDSREESTDGVAEECAALDEAIAQHEAEAVLETYDFGTLTRSTDNGADGSAVRTMSSSLNVNIVDGRMALPNVGKIDS